MRLPHKPFLELVVTGGRAPAVRTFQQLPWINTQAKVPACARERRFTARRNCYLLPQSVEANIDATGIPQYGLGWTAREGHV